MVGNGCSGGPCYIDPRGCGWLAERIVWPQQAVTNHTSLRKAVNRRDNFYTDMAVPIPLTER